MVEIVNDDMPFLVDSVTIELTRHRLGIHLIIHPVLAVRRDETGELLDLGTPARGRQTGAARVSCMLEIDRQSEPEVLAALEADLRRVLADVRHAVDDWRAMRGEDRGGVGRDQDRRRLGPGPTGAPRRGVPDLDGGRSISRCSAIAAYAPRGRLDGVELRRVKGTGLGILRPKDDGGLSQSFTSLPAERAGARAGACSRS